MSAQVNLSDKFSQIHEHWQPHIAAEPHGPLIKLVKFQGEFVWHHHDHEDEMFLVVKGQFRMEFRDTSVTVKEGEFIIVPREIEHKPVADQECCVMLFEPASTLNTGNLVNERTVHQLNRI